MTRLVPTGRYANEALAAAESARGAALLFVIVVAVAAFGATSFLARIVRESVALSVRLFATALATATIGLLAVVLTGALLFAAPDTTAADSAGVDTTVRI